MDYYAGIDLSLEASSVCIVDASGKILREAKVLSQPDNLIGWFRDLGLEVTRIGLEALSQWLYTAQSITVRARTRRPTQKEPGYLVKLAWHDR